MFDAYLRERVLGMITGGISQRTAAAFLEIHPSTISKAIKRDADFRRAVEQAQAAATVRPLIRVIRASEKSWRAAVWLYRNAQPTTDLTERAARRELKSGRRHKRFAAEALSMLDSVSEEMELREAQKKQRELAKIRAKREAENPPVNAAASKDDANKDANKDDAKRNGQRKKNAK